METMRKNGVVHTWKENKDRFFMPQEVLDFQECLNEKQHRTMVILLNTGARINEATCLQVKDIDFENNILTLMNTKIKAAKGEKRGRPRLIPISSQFSRWLQNKIKELNLQPEDTFGILTTSATAQMMKKAAAQAGIKNPRDFSAHNFRKTFEMYLLALNVNPMSITAHLGHDMATAMSHYVSPNIFKRHHKDLIRKIIGDLYE